MNRQLITPETAERTRKEGGYTFNLFPDDDYSGPCIVIAALCLGDHAHLDISSGQAVPSPGATPTLGPQLNRGNAGHLILRWREWLILRDVLAQHEGFRIAEVEKPTRAQLDRHLPTKAAS